MNGAKRASSPARAAAAAGLNGTKQSSGTRTLAKNGSAGRTGAAAAPKLPGARSASNSPSNTPSTSDRLQLNGKQTGYTQKPKPSQLLASRLAGLTNNGESPQNSPSGGSELGKGGKSRAMRGVRGADSPAEAPNGAALSIDVAEAADDDGEFVPEEEEEGPSTQGDHLMMAKASRQKGMRSPGMLGMDSPNSPFANVSALTPT